MLAAALLLLLALLVRQQLSWLNQASASQLASGQKELSLAVTQGLYNIRAQMQLLYADIASVDADDVNSGLITQYLRISYNEHWPTYADEDPRQRWVAAFTRAIGNKPNPFEIERAFSQRKAVDEFLLVSVTRPKNGAEQFEIRILTVDLSVLMQSLLLPVLTEALGDYHFSISVNQPSTTMTSLTEAPLLSYGDVKQDQAADLSLPLSRFLQLPLQERRQRAGESINADSVAGLDRDFGRIYDGILNSFTQAVEPHKGGELFLAVYSPEGALIEKINRQKWRNSFFSIMVLGLLSATVIGLLGMTRRIKSQQQRERDFIASISHELRTPLTVIRSAADNLKDGVVSSPESIARYGLEISKQSKRLSRMIDTTLTYSGLPGRDSQQLETVQGEAFFRDLFGPLIALANEQAVTCHLAIENLDTQITIDADAMRTIGQNLVMNALIHAKPDSGPAHLWLLITRQKNELTLTVADNGPGIPKPEQKQVFAPFVRGKRSEQNQKPGTGLGLSLVQRTVAVLQGAIQLSSPYLSDLGQTEKGCRFTVTLPLSYANEH